MNRIFLFLVMLPSALWKSMGADVEQLRAMLRVKLLMDDRKPMSFGRQTERKKKFKYGTFFNMLMSVAIGCMYMFPLLVVDDRLFALTLYFTLFISVLTLMLITDFSTVLFDTRDKFIVLPRPVNDSTLVLARLLHVFIYLFRVVLPMSIPGWIAVGTTYGVLPALLFPVVLLLTVFMVLFFVNSFYLLVLRLTKPEKFKDVINFFQIITAISYFVCFYLIPRFFDPSKLLNFHITDYKWLVYLPSYWLASTWTWVGFHAVLPGTIVASILAVVFPLVCLFILVKFLSPRFSSAIGAIDSTGSAEYAPVSANPQKKANGSSRLYNKLANALNRSDAAKAGFIITWLQTARSRTFKMRIYPAFAYVPIYFVYLLTMHKESFSHALGSLADTSKFILLLYMCSFVMMQAINYMIISDQYKASWVYYPMPVQTPGHILAGSFKAMWVKYFLPFFVLISAFVIYIWGPKVIFDVVLAMINVTLFAVCMVRVGFRYLPFSTMEQMQQRGSRIIKAFVAMIIPFSLGFGHYFSLHFFALKIIFLVLSCIALWLVWDSYKNTSWEDIKRVELE